MKNISKETYEALEELRLEIRKLVIPIEYDEDGNDNSMEIHDYNEGIVDVLNEIDSFIVEYEIEVYGISFNSPSRGTQRDVGTEELEE